MQPRQTDGEARNTARTTTAALVASDPAPWPRPYPPPRSKTTPGAPASASVPQREAEAVMLHLPPDKNVTGFLAGEVVIVLQDDLVCVPHDHPQLVSGGRKGEKAVRQEGMG